jgi:hypothetical protein
VRQILPAALALTVALCGVASQAAAETWTFKDWTVSAERNPKTGKMACLATTGDGLENLVRVSYEDGSEFAYPDLSFLHVERVARHEPLLWTGAKLLFQFDGSGDLGGEAEDISPFTVNGEQRTAATGFVYNNERALSWMAAGNRFSAVIADTGEVVFDVSLSGFVASYLKIVEQCGTTRDGLF